MTEEKTIDLKMKVFKDSRDGIKAPELCNNGAIIPLGNCLMIGKIKSGKSVVIANLLTNPDFFKNYFDFIFLFCVSPSTLLINSCKIDKKKVFTDGDPEILQKILDTQKKTIKEVGFKKAPKILIIADDMASIPKFMNSKALRTLFFSGSHSKIYVWVTSQSYTKIERSMRLNADAILLFHGVTNSEIERFAEEHQPATMTKKEFIELVNYCIKEPFNFIFANQCVNDKTLKFRKNFEELVKIKA